MARRTRARRAAAPQIEARLASAGAQINSREAADASPDSLVCAQVDKITLLAMGLRMRAVCAELRTLPRFAPKFWGVARAKRQRRWKAYYTDATGKTRTIGYFDDQEEAAHAVNAAIRAAGLEGRRRTNPVDADGRVVPRA